MLIRKNNIKRITFLFIVCATFLAFSAHLLSQIPKEMTRGNWQNQLKIMGQNTDNYTSKQRLTQKIILEDREFRVNDDNTGHTQLNPSLAACSDGSFVIVWDDGRNNPYVSDVYFQLYDKYGQCRGVNIEVKVVSGTYKRYPDVAFTPQGYFVVLWHEKLYGPIGDEIYFQRYDRNGNVSGNTVKVNDDTTENNETFPAITSNIDGSFVVVWSNGPDWYNSEIYLQLYDSSVQAKGSNVKVSDITSGDVQQSNPAVSYHTDSTFVVVWQDNRNGDYDIYLQRFDSSGQALGINSSVNDDVTVTKQTHPSIASSTDGSFVIVWQDERNGNADIYFQLFYNTGQTLVNYNIKVNDDSTAEAHQESPSVAFASDGSFIVVWADYRNGNSDPDIYAQKFRSDGSAIGSNFRVNSDTTSEYQLNPDVTINGNDEIIFVWEDRRSPQFGYDIYAKIMNFEVENKPPSPPTLHSPANGKVFPDVVPVLKWYIPPDPNDDSLHFKVEIDDDGIFGAGTFTFESKENSIGFNPVPPVPQGQAIVSYYFQMPLTEGDRWWRVSAWDGEIYGATSEAWKFTINLAPNPPQNLKAIPGSRKVTLSWEPNTEPDISHYVVYCNQQPNFIPTKSDSVAHVNHPDNTFAHSGLTNGITYYYRLSAVDTFGSKSNFSEKVSATPSGTKISVPVTNYDFGEVIIDSSKIWILIIKNIGIDTLFIYDITWTQSVFSPSPTSGFILPENEKEITVTFRPIANQIYEDTLSIINNDPDEDTLKVILIGRGIPDEPDIEVSVKEYDFGQVEVNRFKDWWLTIYNVGSEILNVYDINWNQPVFTLSDTSFSIPTNDSFKVKVTFKPAAIQNYEDALTIVSNDPDEAAVTIFLTGRGIPPPDPESVSVLPNLFTPNDDGYNDYVEFKYPKMYEEKPVIQIFNLKGRKVKKISDFSNYEYRWYGKDDNGTELEPGVYIYILEVDGKRISSGTITLIR